MNGQSLYLGAAFKGDFATIEFTQMRTNQFFIYTIQGKRFTPSLYCKWKKKKKYSSNS